MLSKSYHCTIIFHILCTKQFICSAMFCHIMPHCFILLSQDVIPNVFHCIHNVMGTRPIRGSTNMRHFEIHINNTVTYINVKTLFIKNNNKLHVFQKKKETRDVR